MFPTPHFLTMDPISIEVARKSIRIMKLKYTKSGYVPILFKEFLLINETSKIFQDSEDPARQEIVDVLHKIKSTYKVKHAVVSLPESQTYIFSVRVPKEAKEDIESSILFNIEENVPVPPKNTIFDYNIVDTYPNGDFDIVVTAVSRDIIVSYTELFKNADIIPISFMTESVATARSVVYEGDITPTLIIKIVDNSIWLIIVEKRAVRYSSEVLMDVENLKDIKDISIIEPLKEAINKLLVYWFTSGTDTVHNKKIEKAILVGDVGSSSKLLEFLEGSLKLDISNGNVWANCFSFNKYIPDVPKDEAEKFVVTIGLSLNVFNLI
jgi:Tfp pilus assembly PilM family ATPase